MRTGPIPPSPSHSRPTQRPLPPKRAHTSSPGESSSSQPHEPHSSPTQGPAFSSPQDHSPGSIIRRPLFHCGLIVGNSDYNGKDQHNENFYDILAFSTLPELRDSMRLVQRYSLEPFMTPCLFFYPHVVIEFYHTMTSKRNCNPIGLHFSINGREGILQATDIAATFNLPVVLANSVKYRQWPHPFPREMVYILSRDTSAGPILFR